MHSITIDDILADVPLGYLRTMTDLDADGTPIPAMTVINLDTVDWSDHPTVAAATAAIDRTGTVLIGVATRALPSSATPLLDRFTCTLAPHAYGRSWIPEAHPGDLESIRRTVAAAPRAASTLTGLLAAGENSTVADALTSESFAYSMLLAGPEFRRWRRNAPRGASVPAGSPLAVERTDNHLHIRLTNAQRHNVINAAMRDALAAALDLPAMDPTIHRVTITAEGRAFSVGGDLDEFGTTPDVVTAHFIRMQQHVGHRLFQLNINSRVELHGACIGAGIEIPAFADWIVATPSTWFSLPELTMGLIPGAGGTVSLARRIGRWRTAYLALSQRRLTAQPALQWGLIDEIC